MINKDNLKDLLKELNFEEKENVFSKYYPENANAYLKVDFKKNILIYPTDKGFIVNGEFTCNFTSDENFVVFECVNRLFEKGYKPEHIELEPKWKVGHGASGGRADILIKDNTGKSLLIIECKTEGTEFKKEWNNTLHRGGQMLTYAKQAGTTQYVCLYASDFADGKVIPNYYVISLIDNPKLLEELADKKPLSFAEAKALEVEDIYKAWKETYELDYATKGIFEDDIQPYQIGKQKYTITDLDGIGSKDIQNKYHEFATIMRQHNVSGRENAFDKLVNLFLCKIVDEAKNPRDLKFNWKGIAYDSYFDLQDRLQLLYQSGMKEFLGEEVTYIDNSSIDTAFRFFKKDPDATRETIKKYFRQLKFFTNNDFAFVDVHNEKLFYQNAEVLLKIVKMLQDIKLQSNEDDEGKEQHQFLGDMFEGFLDNGVKQSEGQFFTPMPIVKFILNSLPLESIIKENELPPKAIDYACGAGHFLNELALQIKPFVKKHKLTDIKEYYKEIVGVEKEYRLSKVAKVSSFMYGQNDIKITYADALGKDARLEDNQFSILVANPPYSVKGFLQTLSETERKNFTLFNSLDEKSWANNNSIETFFIERAKQLLKPGAVAGIILPSSILSNDASVYTHTREIILKYFQIIAITEFGSQTFGKTGTNTVTLFLKRKEENPAPADHWKNRVEAWFTDNEADVVYNDSNYLNNYCTHIEIDVTQYKTLLTGKPNEELLKNEIFVDYKKAFDSKLGKDLETKHKKNKEKLKNELEKKLKKEKKPEVFINACIASELARLEIEQKEEYRKKQVNYLQAIEKDKLYFFVLASENSSKVLVVKCPSDNKEQKYFLGYEWSSAKGNEGIKYINQNTVNVEVDDTETKEFIQKTQGLHNINTPLYNSIKRNDSNKINHFIHQNFLGNEITIIDDLKNIVSYHYLSDLLDFTRTNFNKQISTSIKRTVNVKSKWDIIKIENICDIGRGRVISQKEIEAKKGSYPVYSSQTSNNGVLGFLNTYDFDGEYVTWTTDGIYAGTCFYRTGKFNCTNVCGTLKVKNTNVITAFLPLVLNMVTDEYVVKSANPKLMNNVMGSIKIPLPPKEIQQNIVKDCNEIDKLVKDATDTIENAKLNIEIQFNELYNKSNKNFRLNNDDLFDVSIGRRILAKDVVTESEGATPVYSANVFQAFGFIKKELLKDFSKPSVLWGIDGDWMVNTIPENNPFYPTDHCGVIRIKTDEIHYKYLAWVLNKEGQNIRFSRANRASTDRIKGITIKAPTIKEQQIVIDEIEKLEQIILNSQVLIDISAKKKKEILNKYL
jgi:type I restriction enzyme M protein